MSETNRLETERERESEEEKKRMYERNKERNKRKWKVRKSRRHIVPKIGKRKYAR